MMPDYRQSTVDTTVGTNLVVSDLTRMVEFLAKCDSQP